MSRQRITKRFPWLLPFRKKQRIFCFYAGMRFDKRRYALKKETKELEYCVFRTQMPLYNRETGFDMKYQRNKVFNLKLAAATLDHLLIRPQETFSFWKLVRYADRKTAYKDGLIVVDGILQTAPGGGLCQMSNLLFRLFLHSPLTIIERHGHSVRDFPEGEAGMPAGIDAAVSEGWLDLRVFNDTDMTFQIRISFTEERIVGELLTDRKPEYVYEIVNRNLHYERRDEKLYEEAEVVRKEISQVTGACVEERVLYTNRCEIGYSMPEDPEGGMRHSEEGRKEEQKKIIAVIFGGRSPEYSVSLASAHAVICQIKQMKQYTCVLLGISRAGNWFCFHGDTGKILDDTWCNTNDCTRAVVVPDHGRREILLSGAGGCRKIRVDAAFPVLHGKNGEDGTVQGLLALAGIPVVGCGVLSSALCMDKYRAHELVRAAGVAVPRACLLHGKPDGTAEENEVIRQAETLGFPLFVKPLRAGSSYGVTKAENAETLLKAVTTAFAYDRHVILEEYIPGFEVGCAILGTDSLLFGEVDEIELADGFFDYTEKYTLKTSKIHVPARIGAEAAAKIRQTAGLIYRTLACQGFARVDLFFTPTGEIVFNEVNTIPGFTAHSRFPNMMKAAGHSFDEVIERLLACTLGQTPAEDFPAGEDGREAQP